VKIILQTQDYIFRPTLKIDTACAISVCFNAGIEQKKEPET